MKGISIANKITTLYIDDSGLRLMVTRGRKIHKLADAPLDIDADTSEQEKEEQFVARIKQLFKTQKVKTRKVIIGLSGMHCLSRPISLPELPRAMLEEAIVREAKRVLPVPLEQLYVSWQTVSSGQGKLHLFLEAIPRQRVDYLLKVVHQAGLKPYLMDIKPLALARLVKEPTAVIVDVQQKEFDIVIMVDGIPQPIRTVPFPDEALAPEERLLMVRDELKRTIQFYNSNNPETPVQPSVNILASGELADEPHLCELLSRETGYQVSLLASPLKCPRQMDPTHYLVNVGLALKEFDKEAGPLLANVNTLPPEYQPTPISLVRVAVLPGAVVTAGLLFVMISTIQGASADITSTQDQIDAANFILEQRQTQKTDLNNQMTALEQQIAAAQAGRDELIAASESIETRGSNFNDDLEAVTGSLLFGVNVNSISHSGNGLAVSGNATSEVEALQYARNLEATGRFSQVNMAGITRIDSEASDAVSYTLSLQLSEEE